MHQYTLVISAVLSLWNTSLMAQTCLTPPKPVTTFACDARSLHPTQASLGFGEIIERERKLTKTFTSDSKRDQYLADHAAPVVRGPGSVLYIVDHHHLAKILIDLGVPQKMRCGSLGDFSTETDTEFWKALKDKCWAFLLNNDGNDIPYTSIPKKISLLVDDPYRTLAWKVLKLHGYCKSTTPFAEFRWASYFRNKHIDADEVDAAVTLAEKCTVADNLPGCKASSKTCDSDDEDN